MSLITLDFETYYSREYSLSRMSTEDYVMDPRFDVIMVGYVEDGYAPQIIMGSKRHVKRELDNLSLHKRAVVAHNMMFDGLILKEHFGITPGMYMDTLSMAQALLKPVQKRISLAACLANLDLDIQKGTEVHNMVGRTRDSLTKAEVARYSDYCLTDCVGTQRLFHHLAKDLPKDELKIIDLTLRMYLAPRFRLDSHVLAKCLQEVRVKKEKALASIPPDVTKADLMSNPKFAEVLQRYGVEPPVKVSERTGKTTFAFSKSDPGWKELETEYADDPVISTILATRLSSKSTIEETRSERLLDIANRYGWLRVPLRYYAAHTGRYGGMEKINAQNFPRTDKSQMRFGIKAPKGYMVLAADLSQIEARTVAWLAGCKELVEGFRQGADVYSRFAIRAFNEDTVKGRSTEDDHRRFVGKTCVLGLCYGLGAPRLQSALRKDEVVVSLTDTTKWVNIYRTQYKEIPQLWKKLDNALAVMFSGQGKIRIGPVELYDKAIHLPNGMKIQYPNLRYTDTKLGQQAYTGWLYDFSSETRTLWGGKCTENLVQALAQIIIKENMLKIHKELGIRPALQQHDELDYVVPVTDVERYVEAIEEIMRTPPSWAPDLPLDVETAFGRTLGDCK